MCGVMRGPRSRSPTSKGMGFAEGGPGRNSVSDSGLYQHHLVLCFVAGAPLQKACERLLGLCRACEEYCSPLPPGHPFPVPIMARKHSPLCWVPYPHSHLFPRIHIPTYFRRAAFKRGGQLGARRHGFEAQLWTNLEKPLDLFET